jgi:glycyl-tRNA synthetase beta subunit
MAEFLLELYSEEIPHGLQISAREEIKKNLLKYYRRFYEISSNYKKRSF